MRHLVKAVGHAVDESSLRVLLRRRHPDHDPLTELVSLLSLPLELLESVDNPERFRDGASVELIERTSPLRAWLRSCLGADIPVRERPVSMAYAIGTTLAAGFFVALTAVFVADIFADGFASQAGVSRDDWMGLGVFSVLSLMSVPPAVVRMRQARRHRRGPVELSRSEGGALED